MLSPDQNAWLKDYEREEEIMGRHSSDKGGGFAQAPLGLHVARCYRIIDIGTQHGEYQGKPTTNNQVIIGWELPKELMDDGQPFVISAFFNNFLGEGSKLRKTLEAWRSRPFTREELDGFDLEKLLGAKCMLNVVQNDKGKSVIGSVNPMPKEMDCPPQINKSFAFWLDEFDDNRFAELPEGLQKIIAASDEYKELMAQPAPKTTTKPNNNDVDDDIPF